VNTHLALVPVFRDELGLSIEIISIMVTIPMITQALASLPFGILSDRFEPSKLIALSLLLAGLGGVLVSQSYSVPMLILGFCIISLSLAIFHPPAYSIISELFGTEHRNVALGIHGAGGTLGMATGPISTGLVMYFLGQNSWRLSYLLWAPPALACCLLVILLRPKSSLSNAKGAPSYRDEEAAPIRSVFTKTYLSFLALTSMRSFGAQCVSTYMTTYLKDVHGLSVDLASILFGAMPLMGILASPLGGLIGDRKGEKSALILSYSGDVLTLAGIAFSPALYMLIPFVLSYGFVGYMGMAPSSALVARFTPRGRRGIAYALYFLPFNLIGSIAPVISAYIVRSFGIWYIFPLSIGIFIATIALLLVVVKR
jgi:MFS family permease